MQRVLRNSNHCFNLKLWRRRRRFLDRPRRSSKTKMEANIKFSENLIHCPILEQNLMAIPELKRIAEWLHFQGATRQFTKEEAEAIDTLTRHSSSRT
jgi:hypothetical protein